MNGFTCRNISMIEFTRLCFTGYRTLLPNNTVQQIVNNSLRPNYNVVI